MRGYIGVPPDSKTVGVFDLQGHRELGLLPVYRGIIGVQDTGGRGTDGAVLKQVIVKDDALFEETLDATVFDAHPSYQFPDWTDADGNVFCKIPIAYWWRGNLPDVAGGGAPRWTMLLSTWPKTVTINGVECEFKANPGAFKRSGAWMNQYYIGKYRGHNAGNSKVGSKPGQTHWGSVSFNNYRTYCSNNGADYHMISLFEWQEVCGRMVIEKGTFQIMPEAIRSNQVSCKYRGIEDFAYGPTGASDVRNEWMDGAKTDSNAKIELWDEAGGNYTSTGVTAFNGSDESPYYNQGLAAGGNLDFLFIAQTLGAKSTSFIPDFSGRTGNNVSRICHSGFNAGHAYHGAFHSRFVNLPSSVHADIGSRLAKW